MAELKNHPNLTTTITLKLSEEEARALDAIVGYGEEDFIRIFQANLGSAYLNDHLDGLRSLFSSVRQILPPIFDQLKKARNVFYEDK